MVVQESLTYCTQSRGSIELTDDVARIVARSGVRQGLCHVFVPHTSASLMLCENADPAQTEVDFFSSRKRIANPSVTTCAESVAVWFQPASGRMVGRLLSNG